MNSETPIRKNSKTIYEIIIHYRCGSTHDAWIDEGTNWEFIRDIAQRKIKEIQRDYDISDICLINSIEINQYDFSAGVARCTGFLNLGSTDYELWTHATYFHSSVSP